MHLNKTQDIDKSNIQRLCRVKKNPTSKVHNHQYNCHDYHSENRQISFCIIHHSDNEDNNCQCASILPSPGKKIKLTILI